MRQVVQHLDTGETELVTAPAPGVQRGALLIRTTRSLISSGTERSLVEFGKSGLLSKARQQPEKVRQVIAKAQTDGVFTTLDAVRAKLSQPLALGYCNVGRILEVGEGVEGFMPGDRVLSNGPHAEIVRVGKNLCVGVPANVSDDEAPFAVLASIGLQGIRLAQPALGERFVVTGAGLIGLLTIQLLRAHGASVLAIDFDDKKLALASQFGAQVCNPSKGEDPVAAGMAFSRQQGVDGVIIAASTQSSVVVSEAARMSRKRGRIVLVGVSGLELNRSEFYDKELSFQVSCSYGPGRYDPNFEDKGWDYPIGFVRWTEQRNFAAVLDMISDKRLDVTPLIGSRFELSDVKQAYASLVSEASGLGILIDYPSASGSDQARTVALSSALNSRKAKFDGTPPVVAFLGAGNYASRVLIPAFKSAGAQLQAISTSGGLSGVLHGRAAGFAEASTDTDAVLANPNVNTVAIVTRHDLHAPLVVKALNAGKHVFVEKPLALTTDEIDAVEAAWDARAAGGSPALVMVGFNRRFSALTIKMKELLDTQIEPKSFIFTVNAGAIPAQSWVQGTEGGGRIAGEACHFIDLMRFLAGSRIVSVQGRRMGASDAVSITEDKAAITLGFADGSFGTIHYLANGSASFPKERIEVFCGGQILQLDNFRRLTGFGYKNFSSMRLWKQDKGQNACAKRFIDAVSSGQKAPIPFNEILEVSRVTVEVADLLRNQA